MQLLFPYLEDHVFGVDRQVHDVHAVIAGLLHGGGRPCRGHACRGGRLWLWQPERDPAMEGRPRRDLPAGIPDHAETAAHLKAAHLKAAHLKTAHLTEAAARQNAPGGSDSRKQPAQ